MAALTTCTNGGLMPHARHGGNGVRALAVEGSKLDGTGLENEHIGHTHVALEGGTEAGAGLPCLSGVVGAVLASAGVPRDNCFEGFGKRVILAEDLMNPAWIKLAEYWGFYSFAYVVLWTFNVP
jgi:hypothetical protein